MILVTSNDLSSKKKKKITQVATVIWQRLYDETVHEYLLHSVLKGHDKWISAWLMFKPQVKTMHIASVNELQTTGLYNDY